MKAEIIPDFDIIIDDTIPAGEMHLCFPAPREHDVIVKFKGMDEVIEADLARMEAESGS